tara:strand:- start:10131 stop:10727 length:597 start_codon:yes stop_codon:yes gene_type:complete
MMVAGPVWAQPGLDGVLGLSRQMTLSTTVPKTRLWPEDWPEREWPREVIVPCKAVNEGLVFLAAYQDGNLPAMAAVGAMSLWGATLRSGIDAAIGKATDRRLDLTELHRLKPIQLQILNYLWERDGSVTDREIYLEIVGFRDHTALEDGLDEMEDLGVIAQNKGAVWATVSRQDVMRSMVAANGTEDLKQLFFTETVR